MSDPEAWPTTSACRFTRAGNHVHGVLVVPRDLFRVVITGFQHPHILPLHDSGEADGFLFYVMPHIEGESLRERIDREKQLGVEDSLAITQKVADALDYAHEHGVVHRDIKPGNILLSERGEPLVGDFGIALAVAQAGAGRITETGLSLGTPHYMSPEQATGDRDVDPRSDVYSLGCVLYEMLSGQPPFSATTAQAVLVKILTADAPSITSERRTVPPHVGHALARALEKLPADRFTSAAEFGAALADPSFTYEARARTSVAASTPEAVATQAPATMLGRWNRLTVAFATTTALLAALAAWGWLQPGPEPGVPTRAAVTGVDMTAGTGWRLAISPDGSSILKVAEGAIHIRPANDPEWRQLPNTEGGSRPTFSPDGQSVAFSVAGGISKVSISGGPALPVTTSGGSPHWGFDDTIVYTEGGRIYRVSSSGGDPQVLLESDSVSVRRPHLLPNGRAVVFGTVGARTSRILIFEIETGEVRELVPAGNQPRYVSTGHLIYGHGDGALMGVPFDVESLQVTGAPVTLLPSLAVFAGGASQFGVSNNGTLIYATAGGVDSGATGQSPLIWVDMEGNETPLPLRQAVARTPRLSPEGGRIAYRSGPSGQIWVYDIATGTNTQLTFEGTSSGPIWSPDGLFVYFMSTRPGTDGPDLFRKAADGASEAEQLWRKGGGEVTLTSIAPDGSWVVVGEVNTGTGPDVALASLGTDSVSFREYLRADWSEAEGTISPNGRWMAYTSGELGGTEVFVRGFPEPIGQWRLSEGNLAFDPVWAPDGSALYYVAPPNLMKVDVATEGTFSSGQPTVLFNDAAGSCSPGRTMLAGRTISATTFTPMATASSSLKPVGAAEGSAMSTS